MQETQLRLPGLYNITEHFGIFNIRKFTVIEYMYESFRFLTVDNFI